MKNLFYQLIIFLDTMNENDTNYSIALFMARNFYRIADMKINELADVCYVSPASISRFCRTLGYENFSHLKETCRFFTSNERKFNNLINVPLDIMKNDPKEATLIYVSQVIESMNALSSLDWNTIDQILELIHDSKDVAFFGTQFSQSAAMQFQTDLLMLEKYTTAYLDSSRQLDCAKKLNKESLAIIITVNGNLLNTSTKVLQYIKKSECKVVLLTANNELDLGTQYNYRLLLGEINEKKTGKHTLLTILELMSLRYYSLYYPSIDQLRNQLS